MRMPRLIQSLFLLALLPALQGQAATNLVQNGGFELTTNGSNKQLTATGVANSGRTTLVAWDSNYQNRSWDAGYNFVLNSSIYTTNASAIALRSHYDNGTLNGITASPTGGNVFASDSQYYPGALSQSISGLQAHTLYTLSFDYALGQQAGFDKANSDNFWTISFAGQTKESSKLSIASGGFSGWRTATMTFTANSANEVLSFLASSTASGLPPFLLLDNVALTAAVPEPETWGMLLGGLGLLALVARRRKRA